MARQALPLPTPGLVPEASVSAAPEVEESVEVAAPVAKKKVAASSKAKAKAKAPAVEEGEMIKVKAKQEGFFDCHRIAVGQVFEIKSMEQFSKHWMELL